MEGQPEAAVGRRERAGTPSGGGALLGALLRVPDLATPEDREQLAGITSLAALLQELSAAASIGGGAAAAQPPRLAVPDFLRPLLPAQVSGARRGAWLLLTCPCAPPVAYHNTVCLQCNAVDHLERCACTRVTLVWQSGKPLPSAFGRHFHTEGLSVCRVVAGRGGGSAAAVAGSRAAAAARGGARRGPQVLLLPRILGIPYSCNIGEHFAVAPLPH